jgi:hypothetical protein
LFSITPEGFFEIEERPKSWKKVKKKKKKKKLEKEWNSFVFV